MPEAPLSLPSASIRFHQQNELLTVEHHSCAGLNKDGAYLEASSIAELKNDPGLHHPPLPSGLGRVLLIQVAIQFQPHPF